jgi:hypothetical protein
LQISQGQDQGDMKHYRSRTHRISVGASGNDFQNDNAPFSIRDVCVLRETNSARDKEKLQRSLAALVDQEIPGT